LALDVSKDEVRGGFWTPSTARDTNARKYIQPLLDAVARFCQRIGISANALTIIGMLTRPTKPSPLGAILDITFDRVVEISLIAALAWQFPVARFELVIPAGVIAIAMSLFLSIGAAVANRLVKSFHDAPGLGERTEAFICLSVMMLDHTRLVLWTRVFVGVIVFTMLQDSTMCA
jgi:hypothetical protein